MKENLRQGELEKKWRSQKAKYIRLVRAGIGRIKKVIKRGSKYCVRYFKKYYLKERG